MTIFASITLYIVYIYKPGLQMQWALLIDKMISLCWIYYLVRGQFNIFKQELLCSYRNRDFFKLGNNFNQSLDRVYLEQLPAIKKFDFNNEIQN